MMIAPLEICKNTRKKENADNFNGAGKKIAERKNWAIIVNIKCIQR